MNKKLIYFRMLIIFTVNLNIFGAAKITTEEETKARLDSVLQSPLSTKTNQIIDNSGRPVRIKAVNWFGIESPNLAPHGLWVRNYKSMMNQIKQLGFNAIRLPFCNEALNKSVMPKGIDFHENPDLVGLRPIEVIDRIVDYAEKIGLGIILDHHRNEAGTGSSSNGLWYNSDYPESRLISDWKMLAARYKDKKSVIGADLHNEPHGAATWGGGGATDWHAAAQRIGNEILLINPNLLIFVEGVDQYKGKSYWWGGNLMGVRDNPVRLIVKNKLVYSPHDYPNSVHAQSWFSAASYPKNLSAIFRDNWGYIFEEGIAPVWIGEMGSKFVDPKDIQWIDKLISYINGDFLSNGTNFITGDNKGISWSWWAFNPNSGDTGGILKDDWKTVDKVKLKYISRLLDESTLKDEPKPGELAQTKKKLASVISYDEDDEILNQLLNLAIKESLKLPSTDPKVRHELKKEEEEKKDPPLAKNYEVKYEIKSSWSDGFIANITIRNVGMSPINGWSLKFDFPNNQKITNLWDANFIADGKHITVTNLPRNKVIPAGSNVTFGFTASYSGINNKPTFFNLT